MSCNLLDIIQINKYGNLAGYIDGEFYHVTYKHPQYSDLMQARAKDDVDAFIRIYRENVVAIP